MGKRHGRTTQPLTHVQMDSIQAFKKAIDLVKNSNDAEEISRHLYNLPRIYHEKHDAAALAPYEKEYMEALAARDFSSILKSENKVSIKPGEIVPYEKLTPVKTLGSDKTFERKVLVLLRHP